ncbi:MAG TPA: gliding motility-associated C-terminal domain-containing protein, partial [Flavobacteriales bacterium]|nr:gliding motility-associated C-terminal domain-containing protein [Flavobacteriales bacterium]
PNEDGRDDVFIPEALKTLGVKFRMTIYDTKSGQMIHETRDISHPWNGRIGNKGELCSTGDYMWMVEMKDGDKLGGSYTGTVSLLR